MQIVFERRLKPSRAVAILVPVFALILALVMGGILLLAAGADPIETYRAMFDGAFGTTYARSETLVKAIPLMLTGLAVSIAFRMLFWNTGNWESSKAPMSMRCQAWSIKPMVVSTPASTKQGLLPAG